MQDSMKVIDMQQIIKELKEKVEKRNYSDELLKFEDIQVSIKGKEFDRNEFFACLDYLNCNHEVSYYMELQGGKIKRLLKKIVRKIIKPVLFPMNYQQNVFNVNIVRCLNCINAFINEYFSVQKTGSKENSFFDYHEKIVEKMETKIFLLEKRIEQLESQLKNTDNQ